MAYSRYRRSRRFRRKSTPWYNRKYSTMQLAAKAWRATKYLRGLVNSEMFHADQVITLGASVFKNTHLTAIAQGDGDGNRTGNSILLRSLALRGSVQINPSVTGNTRVCLVLLKDKQQVSDTTPLMSDIFVDQFDPDSLLKTGTLGRFKILWRKTYVLTPPSGGRSAFDFNKYWKLYDHVRFNGPAIGDVQRNGYYFAILTSENTNVPTVSINSRIGYHDN